MKERIHGRRHKRIFVQPIQDPVTPGLFPLTIKEIESRIELEALERLANSACLNFLDNPTKTIEELSPVRTALVGIHPSSRIAICSGELHVIGDRLRKTGRRSSPLGREFRRNFVNGIFAIADAIILGEKEIMGTAEEEVNTVIPKDFSPRKRIAYQDSGMGLAKSVARRLLEDPTKSGLKLVDQLADEIKDGRWLYFREPDSRPDFLTMGANFARAVYKQLYPLTANLP